MQSLGTQVTFRPFESPQSVKDKPSRPADGAVLEVVGRVKQATQQVVLANTQPKPKDDWELVEYEEEDGWEVLDSDKEKANQQAMLDEEQTTVLNDPKAVANAVKKPNAQPQPLVQARTTPATVARKAVSLVEAGIGIVAPGVASKMAQNANGFIDKAAETTVDILHPVLSDHLGIDLAQREETELDRRKNPGFLTMATGRVKRAMAPVMKVVPAIPLVVAATGAIPIGSGIAGATYLAPTSQETDNIVFAAATGVQAKSATAGLTTWALLAGPTGIVKTAWWAAKKVVPTVVSNTVEKVASVVTTTANVSVGVLKQVYWIATEDDDAVLVTKEEVEGVDTSLGEITPWQASTMTLGLQTKAALITAAKETTKLGTAMVVGAVSPAAGVMTATALKHPDQAPKMLGYAAGATLGSKVSFGASYVTGLMFGQAPAVIKHAPAAYRCARSMLNQVSDAFRLITNAPSMIDNMIHNMVWTRIG